MFYLYIITACALVISFFFSRGKTEKALKIAYKKFASIVPVFTMMIIAISVMLYLIPEKTISAYLGGENLFLGVAAASFLGSITLIPGPVAYPLCGILVEKGVSYTVVAAFSITLMMVGILTFSVEREYFGTKVTIVRNLISFVIAVAVAVIIGIVFGEFI